MKKHGFTLLELIVSIVLVSVVMISLLASLIQLRKTYNVIHENSDVLVYSSSATRVINNDLAKNNGIRYITCDEEGHSCDFILGNGSNRKLEVYEQVVDNGTTDNDVKSEVVKSTLKYTDTTNGNKTIYIKTLNMDRYTDLNTGKISTDGYVFLDIDTRQYEYNGSGALLDSFTTLTIRVYDGINFDDTRYNIIIYTSGRYDDSSLNGKVYTIELDPNGGTYTDTRTIDEVFGVGYYRSNSVHNNANAIKKIEIPINGTQAFLGYYYQTSPTSEEIQVIDSSGNVVASPKVFKNNITIADESGRRVYAKWGECAGGYEIKNGACTPKTYTIKFNRNGATNGTSSITVTYMTSLPDITVPTQAGKSFSGYYTSGNTQYYNTSGIGTRLYDIVGNTTLNANFTNCAAGTFNTGNKTSCTICTRGSMAAEEGASACTPCPKGRTNSASTSANNRKSCSYDCTGYLGTTEWDTVTWNPDNTMSGSCKALSCIDGFTLSSSNVCEGVLYYINYDLDGGTVGSSAPTSVAFGANFTLSRPSKEGYTFKGWNLSDGFNPDTAQYYYQSPSTEEWRSIRSSTQIMTIYTYFKNLTNVANKKVSFHANWAPSGETGVTYVTCEAGNYIKAGQTTCDTVCEKNHFCPGGSYAPNNENDVGIFECPKNALSPAGAKSSLSCAVCLSGDSEIEVYDKKKKKKCKKKIKDLTYDDLVLAWDFDKGEFVWAEILWIMKMEKSNKYHLLTFSDGSTLKVIGDHRIFNCEQNRFVNCLKLEIGSTTFNSKGEVVELVSRKEMTGDVDVCNIITKDHINVFANGILTSRGRNNLYKIENMKFVKEPGERFTREDFPEVSDEYFYGLRLGDTLKTYRGKEDFTRESLANLVKRLEESKDDKKRL